MYTGGLFLSALSDTISYSLDMVERQVLFWDSLRQRGNIFLEHREQGTPPVLDFDYDIIIDGRNLERPCNYILLRIIPDEGIVIDPEKRPFVVIDPRAGHGPGIGGFKSDSQVGVAMRAGHAVYFVAFYDEPEVGQTLSDVANAEAIFIEDVTRRHPETTKPCVIGNCQAGWAVAALASVAPDLMGPIILNGAPLSYWAGSDGQNPMRYSGGLLGGKWLATLASDLGNGRFDGANLVSNFEKLDPANTYWKKMYNLYANIDTEVPRFLDFERWWGGFFLMNQDEMDAIVTELFIGNKLAKGDVITDDGHHLDLRNIRSPIVVFASHGDNITPPQQALNWIIDVYDHEENIIANEQVIVYLLHENIGHLGIFVSGRVARKEHSELVSTLDTIDRLAPGLYEMVIEEKTMADKQVALIPGDYKVHFEYRSVDDIRALDESPQHDEYFSTVAEVSEINNDGYQTFVSPWVKLLSNEATASWLRANHPLRLQRSLFSDEVPLAAGVKQMASMIKNNRHPVANDNLWLQIEKSASSNIGLMLDSYRDLRDDTNRRFFKALYGPTGLGGWFNHLEAKSDSTSDIELALIEEKREQAQQQILNDLDKGGFTAAVVRIILAFVRDEGTIKRRSMFIAKGLWSDNKKLKDLIGAPGRAFIRDQALMLHLDQDRALQALTRLLRTKEARREAMDIVSQILMDDAGEYQQSPMGVKIRTILGL